MAPETRLSTILQLVRDAEEKLASARHLLESADGIQIEGERTRRAPVHAAGNVTNVIEGIFDGQAMVGTDKKIYPVPANYASKSKLAEGDTLKLSILEDGSFIYKQIGPIERKFVRGVLDRDARGEYCVRVGNKAYKVLLASVTFYKGVPGDEVTIIIPTSGSCTWGAVENIIKNADPTALPQAVRESVERLGNDEDGQATEAPEPDTSGYDRDKDKAIPVSDGSDE